MKGKKVTFFIVTNERSNPKKIVLSYLGIKLISIGIILFSLLATIGLVDYFGLLVTSTHNKKLKIENIQLKRQFQIVEGKINSLENSLERIKTFSTKLKLITNVESEDRDIKLAIGPIPKPGQSFDYWDEDIQDRNPASNLNEIDKQFFKDKPLDKSKGELHVEKQSSKYATLAIRIDKTIKESQLKEQSILDLWQILSERQSLLNATPSIKPLKGWYTSRFGYRVSPFTGKIVMHKGLDIAATPGTPIYAPADGIVSFSGYEEGYGKLVAIDHGYGIVTRYGHNSKNFVSVGQKVKRWDVISAVGNTGRTTGPHLHYEVRINGIPVDPLNYILDEQEFFDNNQLASILIK